MPVTPPDPRAAAARAVASLHNNRAYPAGPRRAVTPPAVPAKQASKPPAEPAKLAGGRDAVFPASDRRSLAR